MNELKTVLMIYLTFSLFLFYHLWVFKKLEKYIDIEDKQ